MNRNPAGFAAMPHPGSKPWSRGGAGSHAQQASVQASRSAAESLVCTRARRSLSHCTLAYLIWRIPLTPLPLLLAFQGRHCGASCDANIETRSGTTRGNADGRGDGAHQGTSKPA